jgi:hypothetical protein
MKILSCFSNLHQQIKIESGTCQIKRAGVSKALECGREMCFWSRQGGVTQCIADGTCPYTHLFHTCFTCGSHAINI